MTSAEQSLENVIKKNFPNEIQQKRVKKEIQTLRELNQKWYKISLQSTNLGLKVIIEVTKEYIIKELSKFIKPSNASSILFEIMLEPKFPFVFPKIFCRTMFTDPTISDGRDYLNDILGKVWSPATLLSEIVVLIPDFMKRIFKEVNNFVMLQKLGTYHLGHAYNLEDFLVLENVAVFPGQEILVKSNKEATRYLVVTHMSILNFEPINKNKNIVKLITWANIQSLLSIKRKKEDDTALIFTWKDRTRKEGLTQIFFMDDATKCVEVIVDTMKKIGVRINKSIPREPDLRIEDVTAASYADMDINRILENIAILESRLNYELALNVINTLTTLYQKAIEYYSAFSDPAFQTFVNKLQSFLSREDIQAVLQSDEMAKSSSRGGATNNRRQSYEGQNKAFGHEEEDDDEEEEKKVVDSNHNRGGMTYGDYGARNEYMHNTNTNTNTHAHKKEEDAEENLFAIDDAEEELPPKKEETQVEKPQVIQTQPQIETKPETIADAGQDAFEIETPNKVQEEEEKPEEVVQQPVEVVQQAEEKQVVESKTEDIQPESTQPDSTQPESTQPDSTQPESTQLESTQPESTQPDTTQADLSQAESSQPEPNQVESTQANVEEESKNKDGIKEEQTINENPEEQKQEPTEQKPTQEQDLTENANKEKETPINTENQTATEDKNKEVSNENETQDKKDDENTDHFDI